jgi:serine phosphatase RsbU (regulator of sigma subunit)
LPTGSILGMDADVPIAEEKTSLSSGTRVVVFTDGLTEAYGGRGGLDIDEIGTITRAEGLGGLHTAVLTRQPEVVRDDIAVIELVVP